MNNEDQIIFPSTRKYKCKSGAKTVQVEVSSDVEVTSLSVDNDNLLMKLCTSSTGIIRNPTSVIHSVCVSFESNSFVGPTTRNPFGFSYPEPGKKL